MLLKVGFKNKFGSKNIYSFFLAIGGKALWKIWLNVSLNYEKNNKN